MDFSELITTPKLNHVILHRQLKPPICGTLCLTFSHIIVSENSQKENSTENEELWVHQKNLLSSLSVTFSLISQLLHQSIDVIERKPYLVNNQLIDLPGKGHSLILKLKDFRIVTLEIPAAHDYLSVASSIEQLSSLRDPKTLYAFYYRPYYVFLENGFKMFR
jgi:myotubularin-related protein 9